MRRLLSFWRGVILSVTVAAAQRRVAFDARCFSEGEAGNVDRSSTTISLLVQEWNSHELVTSAAAFILKDWLGYNVELVHLENVEQSLENRQRFETARDGVWDVDLESWLLLMDAEHRREMLTVLEPPKPIGYSGRSGLYIMPHSLEKEKFADWWKFYLQPGLARSKGFLGMNQTRLREILGEEFSMCNIEEYPWCGEGEFEGFYVPEQCRTNTSSCVVVEMGYPSWDQGFFEQVISNLKLPMILSYLGGEVLAQRRLEYETTREDVIFYSWSSNWGSEFQGGVRISLPDPASITVIQGYEQNPNGTLRVDYPDVQLVKLISKNLMKKAPEAYWILSQFGLSRNSMLELIASAPGVRSLSEIQQSACDFLKENRERFLRDLLPPCVIYRDSGAVFDSTTGLCSAPSRFDKFRCFQGDPVADRTDTVIRLGQRDWLSHDIMRIIAGLLLSERLGYSVRFENLASIPAKDWAVILEGNQMDAEMESWQVDIFDPAIKSYLDGSGIIDTPKEIGWTGREGLFYVPELASNITYADFYRFYAGPAAAENGFKLFNATEAVRDMNGNTFCSVGSTDPWCTGGFDNFWYGSLCENGPCIEAVMGSPLWAQGTFEQLTKNNNLSIALSYYGGKQFAVLEELRRQRIPALFYGYIPSELASSYNLTQFRGRISFPDFYQGCASLTDRSPYGFRRCDLTPILVYKLRRKDLAVRAPEAAYVLDHLQISQKQVSNLLSMHTMGGGNMSTEEVACWFLTTQTRALERALPRCISDPIANPKIGDIVWSATELSCVQLQCPRNATLSYDSTTGFATCRVCSMENAGTVPSRDQMSCTSCPPGTAPDALAEQCEACPPGRYAQDAATPQCQACPRGRYNPLPRQSRCAVCPRGAVCVGGDNDTASTTFYARSGFFLLGTYDEVVAAFEAKMGTCADCWDKDESFSGLGPFECPVASACRGLNTCLELDDRVAMDGPLCASCSPGFQRTGPDEPCSACPPNWLTIFVILVVSLGGMLGLCVLSWSQDASLGNLRGVYSIVLKILCNFFVQLKAVGQVTDLNSVIKELGEDSFSRAVLTSPVAMALGIGDVLENPSTSIFSLECLMTSAGTSVTDSLYLKVLGALFFLPAALLSTLACVALSTWLWSVFGRPHRWGESSLRFRILLSFSSLAVLELYFLQPMVTSQLLSVYNCRATDAGGGQLDTTRWALDMSVDCDSPVHLRWQLITAIGLLLWSFGIPFLLYLIPKLILQWTSYTLQSREMWSVFGFLYDGFEPDFWYYESWMMLRKTYILITANIFWLSPETRTVMLLTLVIYFRYMHLRDLPYDNRAYMGVDRLQFQSLATFTWLLLGRLFRTMLQRTDNPGIPSELSPLFYLPAVLNFFILIARAIYLVVRDVIWPLQSPPALLPKFLRKRLDHRVTFSFIPPAVVEDARDHFRSVEHGSLSGHHQTDLAEDWELTRCKSLPDQEREILKTILTETAEVLLRRHEIVHGEGAQVIYLPTFLLQMERVIVAAMCYAVKSRIINEELVLNRDTWSKWLRGLWDDTMGYLKLVVFGQENEAHNNILRQKSSRSWEDMECDHLREAQHLVRRPVSTEEIQIALYQLWPDLTDPATNRRNVERNHLREIIQAHRGIVDMHGEVSHIFDSDGHEKSILKRRNRTMRCDDSVLSVRSSDCTQTDELVEESDAIFQRESLRHELASVGVEVRINTEVASSGPRDFKLAL